MKSITRMGRKESGAFDGVTQELSDITELGKGTLNQMTHRSLLYTPSDHDALLEYIPRMSQRTLDCWKHYPDPKSIDGMDYRQGVQMMGDRAWDLYYTFPESVMSLANTDPDVLALKAKIETRIKDPFERIAALKEALHKQRSKPEIQLYEVV